MFPAKIFRTVRQKIIDWKSWYPLSLSLSFSGTFKKLREQDFSDRQKCSSTNVFGTAREKKILQYRNIPNIRKVFEIRDLKHGRVFYECFWNFGTKNFLTWNCDIPPKCLGFRYPKLVNCQRVPPRKTSVLWHQKCSDKTMILLVSKKVLISECSWITGGFPYDYYWYCEMKNFNRNMW